MKDMGSRAPDPGGKGDQWVCEQGRLEWRERSLSIRADSRKTNLDCGSHYLGPLGPFLAVPWESGGGDFVIAE